MDLGLMVAERSSQVPAPASDLRSRTGSLRKAPAWSLPSMTLQGAELGESIGHRSSPWGDPSGGVR